MSESAEERRRIQRVITTQEGQRRFWLIRGESRIALWDLSLEGFGMPADESPAVGTGFEFAIRRDGEAEDVSGQAEVVNHVKGGAGQIGCRITVFNGDGQRRLAQWLADHVLSCASVFISAEEAGEIVSGPSIV